MRAHEVGVGDGVAAARAPRSCWSSSRGRLTTTLPTPTGATGFREPPRGRAAYRRHDPPAASHPPARGRRRARRVLAPPAAGKDIGRVRVCGIDGCRDRTAVAPGEQAFETGAPGGDVPRPQPFYVVRVDVRVPGPGPDPRLALRVRPGRGRGALRGRAGRLRWGRLSPARRRPSAASCAASGPIPPRASPARRAARPLRAGAQPAAAVAPPAPRAGPARGGTAAGRLAPSPRPLPWAPRRRPGRAAGPGGATAPA